MLAMDLERPSSGVTRWPSSSRPDSPSPSELPAGAAFDRAFFPILGVGVAVGIILAIGRSTRPLGWGIVAGTVSSLVVLALLTSLLLVLGVGT